MSIRILIFLISFFVCAYAKNGFDGIAAMSTSEFKCLTDNGYSFFIARAWKSYGNYDETGIQNMKNARAAGWTDVDAYIFPCLNTDCAPPANQVEATIDQLRAENADFGTIWLDIERFDWPDDKQNNRDFITGLIQGAKNRNAKVGVYTNYNNWEAIVGGSWTGAADLPLWWADWNGANFEASVDTKRHLKKLCPGTFATTKYNFYDVTTGFTPFGGWTSVAIHQYSGDVKNPPCVSDMDGNWKP